MVGVGGIPATGVAGGMLPSPEPRGVAAMITRSMWRLCCVGWSTTVVILGLGGTLLLASGRPLGAGMFSLSISSAVFSSPAASMAPMLSFGYGTYGEGVRYGL